MNTRKLKRLLSLFIFAISILNGAIANSQILWLNPQDTQLRNELEQLSALGVIKQPIGTWPLPVDGLNAIENYCQLSNNNVTSNNARHNLTRHNTRHPSTPKLCKKITGYRNKLQRNLTLTTQNNPSYFKSFGQLTREKTALTLGFELQNDRIQSKLAISMLENPLDQHNANLDGSYTQISWGNWTIGAGTPHRWWGPGWRKGMILTTNPRPLPSLYLARNRSKAFSHWTLSWLGPWHLTTFMAQLESNRWIEKPLLWGMRVNFKPTDHLEIGVSRTAMWAGKGRPKDWDTFVDLLAGQDNYSTSDDKENTEPGNQLGGIDLTYRRWVSRYHSIRLYTEVIGEDEAGGLPSRPIGLVGVHWAIHWSDRTINTLIEATDTSLDFWKDSIYNSAYNHSIYQSGYRYYGSSIGNTTDNDSRTHTLGIWLDTLDHGHSGLWILNAKLNRDGETANNPVSTKADEITRIELWQRHRWKELDWQLTLGYMNRVPSNRLNVNKKTFAAMSVGYSF